MAFELSRRTFLKSGSLAAAGLALPWWACRSMPRPDFTAAFLTDMHVDGRNQAPEGWKKSLVSAMGQPVKPDFVITGGDLAYDCLHKGTVEEADAQYALFNAAVNEVVDVPIYHTIGNHDCLGVYNDSGMSPDDEWFGKRNFLKRFNRDKTHLSFQHNGWTFALLDTVNTDNRDYKGEVDAEQIKWLEAELGSTSNPAVVVGHIPLFSNYHETEKGNSVVDHPKETVHNANDVVKAFDGKKVRLMLAGHLHINESWTFRGTEYANIGAVSGSWWRGPRDGFQEGYAMLEFYGDQARWSYVDYNWDPPPEAMERAQKS